VTRIDFYRNCGDKVRVACRLATKAYEGTKQLVVYSPDRATLNRFDHDLWAFQQTRFVPHCFAESPLAKETPIILASSEASLLHRDVLLNLGDEWPPFFASFERLLEIVSTDEADRERARARWTFYKSRGYDLKVIDLEA
jgi:DNA polymerase III subunit chi